MVHIPNNDFHTTLPLTAEEVVGYGRKSTIEKGAAKSINDQKESIVDTAIEFDLPLHSSKLSWPRHLGMEATNGGQAGAAPASRGTRRRRTKPARFLQRL